MATAPTRKPLTVSTPHALHADHIALAKRIRAFIKGAKAVREYVLPLPGQEANGDDHKLFKARAYYLPALDRTIDAFVGMIMSSGAKVDGLPETYSTYTDDVTNDGETLDRFTSHLVREVVSVARGAVVVDYPDRADASTMTRLEAERLGLRAYARFYRTEDVINWQIRTKDGQRVLSQIRLYEDYEEPGVDEWDRETGRQIRVMDIDPNTNTYRVRIFRHTADKAGWQLFGAPRYPLMNGAPLTYIPCMVFGPSSLDPSILDKPPLDEVADVAEALLQNSAGNEWALMFCGCPTVVISGSVPQDADGNPMPIKIGSSTAIILGEGATATMLQMDDKANGAIIAEMERKEAHMAQLGARILINSGSNNISTETAKMERVGEYSVLADISRTIAAGMTEVLRMLMQWNGMTEEAASKIVLTLNTEFVPKGMETGELTEWIKGVQASLVPVSVLFNRLKNHGELPADLTLDQYKEELLADKDEFGMTGTLPPDDPQAQNVDPANQQQAA
jgi:Domain of unknown function (DUF4055)